MNAEFMAFSYAAMKQHQLILGDEPDGARVGWLEPLRMESLVREMRQLGLLEEAAEPPGEWFTTRFLTRPLDAPAHGLP